MTTIEELGRRAKQASRHMNRMGTTQKNQILALAAQALVDELMEGCDSEWRGLGEIPMSGMKLRKEWQQYDARVKYDMPKITGKANPACRCGDVLQGKCKPSDCKVFGKVCTPQHPVGACMVSNEGACSAYFMYGGQ